MNESTKTQYARYLYEDDSERGTFEATSMEAAVAECRETFSLEPNTKASFRVHSETCDRTHWCIADEEGDDQYYGYSGCSNDGCVTGVVYGPEHDAPDCINDHENDHENAEDTQHNCGLFTTPRNGGK